MTSLLTPENLSRRPLTNNSHARTEFFYLRKWWFFLSLFLTHQTRYEVAYLYSVLLFEWGREIAVSLLGCVQDRYLSDLSLRFQEASQVFAEAEEWTSAVFSNVSASHLFYFHQATVDLIGIFKGVLLILVIPSQRFCVISEKKKKTLEKTTHLCGLWM